MSEIHLTVPDRVYVRDEYGLLGVPANVARDQYKIFPDIIFFRNDGWTLGAVRGNTDVEAYELWKGEWTGYTLLDKTGRCIDQVFHQASEFRKL